MNSTFNWLSLSTRLALAIIIILAVAVGCSDKTSPTGPDPRAGNPSSGSMAQTPSVSTIGNPATGPSATPSNQSAKYVANEVLVVLKNGIDQSQLGTTLGSLPLQLKHTIGCRWATVYEMTITDNTPVPDMVSRLKNNSSIRFVEPNYIYQYAEVPYTPNDPKWESNDPGSNPRDSVYDQWGPSMIGAPIVWNEGKGSSDVVVAVIDTGIRRDHEDLEANMWINDDEIAGNGIDDDHNGYIDDTWGWDSGAHDNDPTDEGWMGYYHGSACAGVVAAVQDNNKGVSGVAPGVKIMALKMSFDDAWESVAVEAINYAVENGADIISMSWGGTEDGSIIHAALDDAWDNGNGINLLACAQNYNSTDLHYPAAYSSVMAIGATVAFSYDGDQVDEKKITPGVDGYSWGSNYGPWLTVMGFGEKYITTDGSCTDCYYDGVMAGFFNGTSCATPMSAGVMALIRSFYPGHTAQWYWDRLQNTADDLDQPGFDDQTGYGRCNALRAIYGSDRYAAQEDANGFVTLALPDSQVFDSIHDVPGNPFYDTRDLYRFTASDDAYLSIDLDIYTLGENLDIALYSDEAMTNLLQESVGPNHAGSNTENISLNVSRGQEVFLKVFSPAVGNSTTYGLHVHELSNRISVTGTNLAPELTHQGATGVPFLKLTIDTGYEATLDRIVFSKHGSLPNDNWIKARLFRDTNSNGTLDQYDSVIGQVSPEGMNRVRFSNLNIAFDWQTPLVLFFTSDFSVGPPDVNVSFSLESYKDVTTKEGIVAPYNEFPISSDSTLVTIDNQPPEWVTTTGVRTSQPKPGSAKLGWNKAEDVMSPPVKYNVYYTDSIPFDIQSADKLSDVNAQPGTSTDFEFIVPNLPSEIEKFFVVRAEDQSGNEDENLVVINCTPGVNSDPENPVILNSYPLEYPYSVNISQKLLVVADGSGGLRIFDRTDPVNLQQKAVWTNHYTVTDAVCTDDYVYCCDSWCVTSLDVTTPSSPQKVGYIPYPVPMCMGGSGNWLYPASDQSGGFLPIDTSVPGDLQISEFSHFAGNGIPYEMKCTPTEIYLALAFMGIESFNIADPAHPSHQSTFGNATALAIGGNTLYSIDYDPGTLTSYDIGADPADPPYLDSIITGPGTETYGVVIRGDYAYVARSDYGLVVFDVSDPSVLKYVGGMPCTGMMHMVTDGTYIYACSLEYSTGHAMLYVVL